MDAGRNFLLHPMKGTTYLLSCNVTKCRWQGHWLFNVGGSVSVSVCVSLSLSTTHLAPLWILCVCVSLVSNVIFFSFTLSFSLSLSLSLSLSFRCNSWLLIKNGALVKMKTKAKWTQQLLHGRGTEKNFSLFLSLSPCPSQMARTHTERESIKCTLEAPSSKFIQRFLPWEVPVVLVIKCNLLQRTSVSEIFSLSLSFPFSLSHSSSVLKIQFSFGQSNLIAEIKSKGKNTSKKDRLKRHFRSLSLSFSFSFSLTNLSTSFTIRVTHSNVGQGFYYESFYY